MNEETVVKIKTKRERKVKEPKIRIAKESDERYTPEYVLDVVHKVGPIVLDPCTTADNRTGAQNFFTFEDDGFTKDWYEVSRGGLIFVNPPFSKLRDWTRKCSEEGKKGCNIVTLLPGDTSTVWFQNIVGPTASGVCFWRGRIEFIRTSKAFNASAMQPTLFAFWGNLTENFRAAYADRGIVLTRTDGSLML